MHFFIYARFLIEITSTSQTSWSGSQHFLGRINNSLLLCNNSFDQKLPDALALAGFSMFGLTIIFVILFMWQTADACHVNGTKHGLDVSIVGS